MTGDDYDLLLHCTIGHLRRVDGALPDFDDGEKALNLLAPPGAPRYIFCIFCIFCIFLFVYVVQTLYALVAACLWILVLFHDSSCNWHPSTEDPSQIGSQD
jgi:hypothetical protein